jgi:hypothetical protein
MVLKVLVWAGMAAVVVWQVRILRRERGLEREYRQRGYSAVKASLDEDVSALNEDLWRLGRDLADADYDGDARRDYERAVVINAAVRRSVDQLRSVTLADAMTEALAQARYAMACARSRLAEQPIPERRLPCFFNPRHGPSIADVRWHHAPGEPVDVPACAAHAPRIAVPEEPDSLQVWTGSKRVPYWEATGAFYAYATGYFNSDWAGSKDGALAALDAGIAGPFVGLDSGPIWGIEVAGGAF